MKSLSSIFFMMSTLSKCSRSIKQNVRYVICAIFVVVTFCLAFVPSEQGVAQQYTSLPMTGADKTLVIEGLRAVNRDDWDRAEQQFAKARDPLAAKLYEWLIYTKGHGDFDFVRITQFMKNNPDLPWQGTMTLNAEKVLDSNVPDHAILDWFSTNDPKTSDGVVAYLEALRRKGDLSTMKTVAREWWKTAMLLTPESQSEFYAHYGRLLDPQSNIKRWNGLLFGGYYTNARIMTQLLPAGYKELTEARIALSEQLNGVDGLIEKVPHRLSRDPGLMFERLRWRRRAGHDFGAIKMLHDAPPVETIPNAGDWWGERHILARRFIENKQYDSAYELVSKHIQKNGFPFAQAEFLAGWLALEHVKKPVKAFEHFEALYYKTKTPISKSRGAYWAGKASLAMGHKEIADQWFRVAARYPTAFYGQMALERLKQQEHITGATPPIVMPETRAYFERNDLVQISRLLYKANMRNETGAFLEALGRKTDNSEQYALVAELAHDLGQWHRALGLAKKGLNKGIFMMDYAYPTMLSSMQRVDIEWALVHAIIRQESAFDVRAQSHAGAQGLMQLMPATAKETARKIGVGYRKGWLGSRPDYNILLGSKYLEQMLDRYDGAYVLAIAAYNGGPGRVDRWLEEFGDPRKREIDYINWIETIPVYETRNYVQRVLEATYIYRFDLKDIQKYAPSRIHVALN